MSVVLVLVAVVVLVAVLLATAAALVDELRGVSAPGARAAVVVPAGGLLERAA